jgi:hypothetical protein
MDDDSIKKFRTVVLEAAHGEGIQPFQVTTRLFRKYCAGIFSNYKLETSGGFLMIRAQAFPPPPCPLVGLDDDTVENAKSKIVTAIGDCGEHTKTEPCDVTYAQFAHYISQRYGVNNRDIEGHVITRLGGFYRIRDDAFPPVPTRSTIERHRTALSAAEHRKTGAQVISYHSLLEQVEQGAAEVFKNLAFDFSGCCPSTKIKKRSTKRIFTLAISDTHIGSDIKGEETGNESFGTVEESRRLASVVQQTLDYKNDSRDDIELELIFLGDLIQGKLHDPDGSGLLSRQINRATWIFSQAVTVLSAHFPVVRVRGVSGNHDRITSKNHGRAISEKHDSYATIIYRHVQMICSRLPNVTFFFPKTPHLVYEAFDQRFFATHGDGVLLPGNPSKNIQIERLERQTNRFNAMLRDKDEYNCFFTGHVHTASLVNLMNKAKMITNSALCPNDDYALSIGVPESACGQTLIQTVPGKAVDAYTILEVGREQDEDSSLDSLIKPFPSSW